MARAHRVDEHDVEIGAVEAEVVVAPVPEDDVGLVLDPREDAAVVDAGVDDVPDREVRLVLFALFDGAGGPVEVGHRLEALDRLAHEIAVGHRVAHDGDAQARAPQELRERWRVTCDFPMPVRTAQTAITGRREGSIVACGPSSAKSAPAASTIEALCMTSTWATSE